MKVNEFIEKLIDIANSYNTLYVMGGFGIPLTKSNAERWIKSYPYNSRPDRKKMIENAVDTNCFGFDCVCLVKAVLWGWNGDYSHKYGGVEYQSNGVPDASIDYFINHCTDVSEDFSKIEKGEFLYMKDHCGIYIGDGLAVECSPKWENKVQITAVGNIGAKEGYNSRKWVKHGKLPYVDYSEEKTEEKTEERAETPEAKKNWLLEFLELIFKLIKTLGGKKQ